MSRYRRFSPTKNFQLPQQLMAEAIRYFEWVDDHQLQEEKIFQHQGNILRETVAKCRPYTKKGLANFIGVTVARLNDFGKRPGWEETLEYIEQVIYAQKFENAAAGLLNSTIVSRDLGLAERSELSGPEGGPIQQDVTLTGEALRDELKRRGLSKELVVEALGSENHETD